MLYLVLVPVFLIGCALGSFLNLCAERLILDKSILWPSSHCLSCFQPLPWTDNIPLLGYWLRRGRCRYCGQQFSIQHFWVELFTGLGVLGLFYLEIVLNVLDIPLLRQQRFNIEQGLIEPVVWLIFAYHTVLVCFLLTASLCDLRHMEIPLPITVTGTLVGLVGGTLLPWPYPNPVPPPVPPGLPPPLPAGIYPWPVWDVLPDWLPAGSWRLGLATSLAGALVGMVVLRGVRFLFGLGRGIEGVGMGDADLMMMAGSFVGWQPILVAFFISVFPALFFGLARLLVKGDQALPFGPSLAAGVMLTLLDWPAIGGHFRPVFFDAWILGVLGVAGAVFLLLTSFLLRLIRGTG